jgi:hypothetical protein
MTEFATTPAVAGIEPKTVPPFAVIAGTGKELPPGETATIAIPDALSTSYSSFLLTDDMDTSTPHGTVNLPV